MCRQAPNKDRAEAWNDNKQAMALEQVQKYVDLEYPTPQWIIHELASVFNLGYEAGKKAAEHDVA